MSEDLECWDDIRRSGLVGDNFSRDLKCDLAVSQEEIVEKANRGERLTQWECDVLNNRNRGRIRRTLDRAEETMMDRLTIKPGDSPQQIVDKVETGKKSEHWFERFFGSLTRGLKKAVDIIYTAIVIIDAVVKVGKFFCNIFRLLF